jgi:hypothetical protein
LGFFKNPFGPIVLTTLHRTHPVQYTPLTLGVFALR